MTQDDTTPSPIRPTSMKKVNGSDNLHEVHKNACEDDDTDFKDSAIGSDEEEKITEETVRRIEQANAKTKKDIYDLIFKIEALCQGVFALQDEEDKIARAKAEEMHSRAFLDRQETLKEKQRELEKKVLEEKEVKR